MTDLNTDRVIWRRELRSLYRRGFSDGPRAIELRKRLLALTTAGPYRAQTRPHALPEAMREDAHD